MPLTRFLTLAGLVLTSSAVAYADSINLSENGTQIGTLTFNIMGDMDDQYVAASFQATDGTGTAITLSALAMSLGEDHFNWLQFANPTNAILGIPAGGTAVDPAVGGQGALWADNLPWYLDEVAPPDPLPAGKTSPPTEYPTGASELADASAGGTPAGSELQFSDGPGSGNANTVNFTTCLVSIGPGNIYTPVGGFNWTATLGGPQVGMDSGTNITALASGCGGLSAAQQTLVSNFGTANFQITPEPGTIALMLGGLVGLLALKRKRLV